jgi:mRNA-degrading endonuclease YafQ of YafQ-DinJ toxin-antitoxin module
MRFFTKKSFDKSYVKLDSKTKKKFKQRRDIFSIEPNSRILNIHKLHGEYAGLWSMNITADVRAIFKKQDDRAVVFVDIGTHGDLFE